MTIELPGPATGPDPNEHACVSVVRAANAMETT